MPCNKLRYATVCLLILALGLSACSSAPRKASDGSVAKSKVENVDSDAEMEQEETFVPIPPPPNANKVNVPEAAKVDFARAKQLMQSKRWKEAESALLLMSETYPQLAGVYTNLGIVYERMEKFDEAEKAYKFAIATNKTSFDAYTNLGVLYRELGKFDQAEAVYKDALAQWPHHYDSRLNLGILYDLYLGKPELALVQFKIAHNILGGDDKTLKGWIIDLERRMPAK